MFWHSLYFLFMPPLLPLATSQSPLCMSFMYSFHIDVLLYIPLFRHHFFPVVPNPTYTLVVLKSIFPGGWSYSTTTARRDLLWLSATTHHYRLIEAKHYLIYFSQHPLRQGYLSLWWRNRFSSVMSKLTQLIRDLNWGLLWLKSPGCYELCQHRNDDQPQQSQRPWKISAESQICWPNWQLSTAPGFLPNTPQTKFTISPLSTKYSFCACSVQWKAPLSHSDASIQDTASMLPLSPEAWQIDLLTIIIEKRMLYLFRVLSQSLLYT